MYQNKFWVFDFFLLIQTEMFHNGIDEVLVATKLKHYSL